MGRDDRFTILMGLSGCADVVHRGERVRLDFGQTVLLPAAAGTLPGLTTGRRHRANLRGAMKPTMGC